MTRNKLKSQELVKELAAAQVRFDAAAMSNWEHDIVYRDTPKAKAFRKECDDRLNEQRWAFIVKTCARYGLTLPILGAS